MPFLVTFIIVHLTTTASVMKVALVTFGKIPSILSQGSWSGGGSGSENRHYLLLLERFLGRLVFLVVQEVPFVVSPFCLFGGGHHGAMAGTVVDDLLCQLLTTIKSSRL